MFESVINGLVQRSEVVDASYRGSTQEPDEP